MRPLRMIITIFSVILTTHVIAFAQTEAGSVASELRSSVVAVISYDQSGKVIAKGSGFFATDRGDVVTSLHLIQGARVDIRTLDGKVYPLTKKLEDKETGLVWMTANIEGSVKPLNIARGAPLSSGKKVTLLSADKPVSFEMSEAGKQMQLNIQPSSDFSGSPIVDSKGAVVAVVSTKLENGTTRNLINAGETLARIVPTLVYIIPSEVLGYPYSVVVVPGSPSSKEPPRRVERRIGILIQGSVIKRVEPVYPSIAKATHTSGTVIVEAIVDEEGNIIEARVTSGHPFLRDASLEAARSWKFARTTLDGVPVKVLGTISLNFHS